MSWSVLDAKAELIGALHGTTLNQIQNIDGIFNRAARQLLLDLDPQETKRIIETTTPIYSSVYDYACPADLKGNKVIDIRPQVGRLPSDIFVQLYNKPFDANKESVQQQGFTMNFDTGVKTIRVNNPLLSAGVTINEADTTNSNGLWSAVAPASNLSDDSTNFASGASSLKFDLSGTGGYLENSTMSSVDLTDYLNQASLFTYVWLPTGTDFTSFELRWGSDSTNYWTKTVTSTQQTTAFENGWNLLSFNWLTATKVGTPDVTAINYLRIVFNTNGAVQTGVHFDNVVCRLGQIMEIIYYSKYLFKDAITLAFQETVSDDSNLINLDTESYNLFFNLLCYLTGQQQQGVNATIYDAKFFQQAYVLGVQRYSAMYKSEIIFPRSTYYSLPKSGYNRYFNRRTNY